MEGDVLALRGPVKLDRDADHPEADRPAPDRPRHGASPHMMAPVWRTGRLSTRCTGYPQSCQHKLLINNNLRGWIMPAGRSLSGDSAHGKNQGAGFCAGRVPPTARRMRPSATESAVDL